jgi:hypothetical protein
MADNEHHGFLISAIGIAAVIAIILAGWIFLLGREPERWFAPGELGYEPGAAKNDEPEHRAIRGASFRGFLTRAFSGVNRTEEQEWVWRNHLTKPLAFSHHLAAVFPPGLASIHSEFFPLVNGARLRPPYHTSFWNPDLGRADVAHHVAVTAIKYFDDHPNADSFALGVNDGLVFGESAETLDLVVPARWFRGRPDYSRLVFTFMNRAAGELARSCPNKYLGALAYYWCENAPPFAVDPHVIPFLTADRSQSYDTAFRAEEWRLQERWAAARTPNLSATPSAPTVTPAIRLGLYDYLYGGGFLVPRTPIHAIAEHLGHAHEVGFTDYFAEVNPNWGLDGPMPWVVAQLLRDPEQNVDRLCAEYFRRYYQEAGAPMQQFYARCEGQWMSQPGPPYWLKHYRNESQAALFPPAVCGELHGLLREAAANANSDDVRHRVAFVADSFGVTQRFVAFDQARVELGTHVLRNTLAGETGAAILQEYFDRREDFVRYAKGITRRWPLAFFPINYDDFLRNDPAFAAALVLENGPSRFRAGHLLSLGSLAESSEISFVDAVEAAKAVHRGERREILPNGSMEGALQKGITIAGLAYGIDLPPPWHSQVEPVQHHVGAVTKTAARGGVQGLRISGAENTTVFQWVPITVGKLYMAAVHVRGLVSSSDAVTLTLGWLDAQQHPVGNVRVMRLPDGSWPDWVQLQQGEYAPAGAIWAGVGIRVQHQVAGDWAEFDDFSLQESTPARSVAARTQ